MPSSMRSSMYGKNGLADVRLSVVDADDQRSALAARRHGAQVHAEVLGRGRLHPVERVIHRERQRDVRQRKNVGRISQGQRADLLGRGARLGDALDHVGLARTRVGDDRRREIARRIGQQPLQHVVAVRAEQRTEAGAAIQVEQHELAAVRRQMGIERIDDRPRADREVDDGLEREHGRQFREPAIARVRGDLLLQRARDQ